MDHIYICSKTNLADRIIQLKEVTMKENMSDGNSVDDIGICSTLVLGLAADVLASSRVCTTQE